ncbi:hypothetical protein H8K47_17155 [Undibacterium sp. CY7W]|uniref:Uncharacterized protein n=1 Tax=Undibacterium rugosum TaxID=2762291 RepID=A0A923KWW8_9BURK|nr:hypothetical protein [Undibacterium rugosum]MBC3937087.1 hypothetical protein [Undibacterium rugosum]
MDVLTINFMAITRMFFMLLHVFAVVAAGMGIAFGDYAIFARHKTDANLLGRAGLAVSVALFVLWVTGLSVIWMDTGFVWAVLATKPKLLAKLTVVILLTMNGIALHKIVFKRLCEAQNEPLRAAKLPAVLGAISVVTWLYAAFLGLAKPVASLLGYVGFMGLYFFLLIIAIATALALVSPRLARRLTHTEHSNGLVKTPNFMDQNIEKKGGLICATMGTNALS